MGSSGLLGSAQFSATLNALSSIALVGEIPRPGDSAGMMQTIEETYRERLRELVQECGSQAALAAKIERSTSQLNQWIKGSKDSKTGKPRSMDRSTARHIERRQCARKLSDER